MTYKIKDDGSGNVCVVSDEPDENGNVDREWLPLGHIVWDHLTGHGFRVDPQKHALHRLSPTVSAKLKWCEQAHPRAEPNIFSGEPEPVVEVEVEVEDEALRRAEARASGG